MAVKKIAVSVMSAVHSLDTVKYSIYLAKQFKAKIICIFVVDESSLHDLLKAKVLVHEEAMDYERELFEQGRHFFDRVKIMAQNKGVEFEGIISKGIVHKEVLDKTKEAEADLLVMGDLKDISSIKETFYNPGERILRGSPCPVVIVKNPAEVERLYKEI